MDYFTDDVVHMGLNRFKCRGCPNYLPQQYSGSYKYDQCRMVTVKVGCNPGDAGCSCTSGQPASANCKKNGETEQCTVTNIEPSSNSNSMDYFTGNVVHMGLNRFKCRG